MRASLAAFVGAARAIAGVSFLLLSAVAIALIRTGSFDPYLAVGGINPSVAALTPTELKSGAAGKLELATSKGGSGYAFEIVQTSTITARPGGPLVDIPDPANGRVIIGQAESYLAYTLLERGVVSSAGFWSEMRSWPIDSGVPDWDKAELRRSALVRDGEAWRNDRSGWYRAEVLPGIGLDPVTATLLPRLLRQSEQPTRLGDGSLDGAAVLRVAAVGEIRDIPGVVAADGERYTRLTKPIEFSFDGIGRLVAIHVVAVNTNLSDYDLVVDTMIRIRYDGVSSLPAPEPALDAEAAR